jgi:hypothetical protein
VFIYDLEQFLCDAEVAVLGRALSFVARDGS